jgi:hypothetical protein
MSTRQKLNTKSSTEAELVGVDDAMSLIVWTKHFMEAQGYIASDNVVYQDNQSAMLLERNGRASSGKRTRHVDIRYFFVADRIKKKQLRVEYCPTEEMIADFFTKPLQGSLFRKFRTFLLNLSSSGGNDIQGMNTKAQECVGTSSQRDDVNNVTASGSVKVDDASYLSMDDERFYDDVDNSQNSKWTVINRRNRKPRG